MKKALIKFWLLLLATLKFTAPAFGLKATLGRYWSVPATVAEASATGWELDDEEKGCHNFGKYSGYRWVEKNNTAIGLLFNWEGDLCGVQMLVDYDIFKGDDNSYKFYVEPMYQVSSVGRKLFWTLTAYFCHPRTICDEKTSASEDRFVKTLYYQNGVTPDDQYLLEVPYARTDAVEAGWFDEHCFDGMGYHNFWYVREFKVYNCTRFLPTLLVFDNYGYRQGFGFWVMGQVENISDRLEEPPGWIVKIVMGDDTPDCMINSGTTTIHFFSIDDPANFKCSS